MIETQRINQITVHIEPMAELKKADALNSARLVESVTDSFEAETAGDALKMLSDIKKGIEAARKDAKAPVLAIGRKIDDIAKEFVEEVEVQHRRIGLLLGEWQKAEREKQRKAEAEARRLEYEAYQKAQAEQAKRIAEENSGRTGSLTEDLEKIDKQAAAQVAQIRAEAVTKSDAVAGVKVRTTTHFEIIDEQALFAARPDLFSPDEKKIRAALKITKSINGLKVWDETKAY